MADRRLAHRREPVRIGSSSVYGPIQQTAVKQNLMLCFQGCHDSNMVDALDHVILPKHVTDAFYATLSHCYEDVFASSQELLKPKATCLIGQKLELSMARSLPALTGPATGGLALVDDFYTGPRLFDTVPSTRRVGENIDEFIRAYRQDLLLKGSPRGGVCKVCSAKSAADSKSRHRTLTHPSGNSQRPSCSSISLSLPRTTVFNR